VGGVDAGGNRRFQAEHGAHCPTILECGDAELLGRRLADRSCLSSGAGLRFLTLLSWVVSASPAAYLTANGSPISWRPTTSGRCLAIMTARLTIFW
jgi:hypothetical protein